MSVKIRLSLTGKSHQISYRLVAQDTHSKRDGKFLEILGSLNPYQKTDAVKIKKDRIKYYLSHGATFTPSAKFVFENGKLAPKPKNKKKAIKKAQEEAAALSATTPASTTTENQPEDTTTIQEAAEAPIDTIAESPTETTQEEVKKTLELKEEAKEEPTA